MTEQNNENIQDFLENDDQVRGQNYVCLSFVSPEEVIQKKDFFMLQKYLRHLVEEKKIDLDEDYINTIDEKYNDFLYNREEKLEEEYNESNNFYLFYVYLAT